MTAKIMLFQRPVANDIHPSDCRCDSCEPFAPSVMRFRDSIMPTIVALSAGLVVGVAIAAIYDRLAPGLGVGLSVVFGS
ncbi:MAG: hypothetical protein M3Y22_08995 [Pseudomonadota bacterium]|nr:hypothetical protein [Pseudomonadota bacterium]